MDAANKKRGRVPYQHRDPVVSLLASVLDDGCIIAPPCGRCKTFLDAATIFVSSAEICRRPPPVFLCRNTTNAGGRASSLFDVLSSLFPCRFARVSEFSHAKSTAFFGLFVFFCGFLFFVLLFAKSLAFSGKRCRMKKAKLPGAFERNVTFHTFLSFAALPDGFA